MRCQPRSLIVSLRSLLHIHDFPSFQAIGDIRCEVKALGSTVTATNIALQQLLSRIQPSGGLDIAAAFGVDQLSTRQDEAAAGIAVREGARHAHTYA